MAQQPRVVFASALDSLFSRELRQRVTPALATELKALGVHLDRPFLPACEVETWARCVTAVARHLHPGDPLETAMWKVGRSTVKGYQLTLIGKAVFGVLRLVGPARSLERATRSFATTNNYTLVKLVRLGPTSFDFTMNEVHTNPYYDMGIVAEVLEQVGARSLETTLVAQDAEGFTMRLRWAA